MRYPFATIAPLLAHMTAREVAEHVDVSDNAVRAWRARDSTITEENADRLATALHVHPAEIWPNWQADVTKPCERCSTRFVPGKPWQRFCGASCRAAAYHATRRPRQAAAARAKYQSDPDARAAMRARSAEYQARYREQLNAAERRRYQANAERERERRRARYWADPEKYREAERLRRARRQETA
jgi:hypothetical protein